MAPLFHLLRDVRSGKPRTRRMARESSWSHANYQGYLTACESAMSSLVERATGQQLTLLKRIAATWEARDKHALCRLVMECEVFFDPQKPSSLVHFAGLGGIDLFVRLICDNADWLTLPSSSQSYAPSMYRHDEGMSVYNTLLRVLTELLVCHNDMGWYIYDRHRGLFYRLLELILVERLRDSAIMLLEHLVSVVGPVFHIPTTPQLIHVIRTINDVGLASFSRVLALTVVPGVMTDQIWRYKRLEPFPQCLVRIRKIQQVVDDNVKWIIDETKPNLLERLLKLAEVRSAGVRIFQGNRTVTVMVPPEPTEPTQFVPAGVAPASSVDMIVNQLTHWSNAMQQQLQQQQQQLQQLQQQPQSGAQLPFVMNLDFDEDDMDEEDWEDEEEGDMHQQMAPLSAEVLSNPAALQAALHQILMQSQNVSGTATATTAVQQSGAIQPPIGLVLASPGITATGGTAAAGGAQPQTLQSFAETLSQEMLPVNNLDSINFAWFCGRPDTKARWRLENMRVFPEEDVRTAGTFNTKRDLAEQNQRFVQRLVDYADTKRQSANQKQKQNIQAAENQSIVNSQSEIFFVINSVMVTTHYTAAWHALTKCNLIPRANCVMDAVFFLSEQSTSIHASPPRGSSGAPSNSSRCYQHFESPDDVAARYDKLFESFWNHPSKMAGVSTSAPKNADEFESNDDDSSGAPEEEDDPDNVEDDGNHRHDPDTLRKLELLRIVHEYWNVQDRTECRRLHKEAPQIFEVDPLFPSLDVKDSLARKIANQLLRSDEDACTETIATHSLEAYVRCFSFYTAHRGAPNSPQNLIGDLLMSHILEERVYNATKTNSSAHSLQPWKRIDGFFALLGEIIKYNPRKLLELQDYVMGRRALPDEPKVPTVNATPSSSSTGAGSASQQQQQQQVAAPPLARAEKESFVSVLQYRLRRFGVDTNLFLRGLVLSLSPNVACPVNYVWKPFQYTTDEVVALDEDVAMAEVAILQQRDASHYLPGEARMTESSSIQMDRIYFVRKHSRRVVVLLSELAENDALEQSARDEERYVLLSDALDVFMRAPHQLPLAERPLPNLFSTEERTLLSHATPLPRAGLSPSVARALMRSDPSLKHNCGGLLYGSGSEYDVNLDSLRELETALLGEPEVLVYQMLSGMNAESIENTERLCVVTTSLLVFLRASALSGQQGIDLLLSRLHGYATMRQESRQRASKSTCARCSSSGKTHNNRCSIAIALDEQCDNFAIFGACRPHSEVDVYFDVHGGDFFKNFFRLLAIWLCHYSCSQRYVETLYYCTNVPFGEWKVIALYVWRRLPEFFMKSQNTRTGHQ